MTGGKLFFFFNVLPCTCILVSDSWSRFPTGLLVSTSHQMGVYDECVEVRRPIQGKYCIPSVKLQTTTDKDFTIGRHDKPETYDPAWREILGVVMRTINIHVQYYAVMVDQTIFW